MHPQCTSVLLRLNSKYTMKLNTTCLQWRNFVESRPPIFFSSIPLSFQGVKWLQFFLLLEENLFFNCDEQKPLTIADIHSHLVPLNPIRPVKCGIFVSEAFISSHTLHTFVVHVNWYIIAFCEWASSWDYGTYHIGNQRRLRRACASAQSRQSLRCSHTWSMEVDERSNQKSD